MLSGFFKVAPKIVDQHYDDYTDDDIHYDDDDSSADPEAVLIIIGIVVGVAVGVGVLWCCCRAAANIAESVRQCCPCTRERDDEGDVEMNRGRFNRVN